MQVILLEKNEKLGNLGDIANVKSGYARNYLIPQGKAKPANKANMAVFETLRAELESQRSCGFIRCADSRDCNERCCLHNFCKRG